MAIPKPTSAPMTYADFLKFEETSTVKHEFRNGEVLAMSGGTYEHSLIITNVISELASALKGKPCRVLDSNMKVLIQRRGQSTYPDAIILCGDPQFALEGRDRTTILNPRVIVEVLSLSTRHYDSNEKFDLYTEIDSFEEYILISTTEPRIVSYRRLPDRTWRIDRFLGPSAVLEIASVLIRIPLAEIYSNVSFPPPPASPSE